MKIKVRDGLEIGDGCPTFIIAEVGSNWRSFDDCFHSIRMAKECGADAVKFQLYDYASLYGTTTNEYCYSLSLEWLPLLKAKADEVGIEFMCSAFSPGLIEAVNPHVNIHKLASAEMCHVRMLEKLRSIGKPVIMSTGAHTMPEIHDASILLRYDCPLILLYCVAAYPARIVEIDAITALRDRFDVLSGYSDHSTDVLVIPQAARDAGAVVIEKHFTAIPGVETPDSPHSLTPDQFNRMVKGLRRSGETFYGFTQEETPMRMRHHRRLIATRDIKVGEMFDEDFNFGIYRSLKDAPLAYSPFDVHVIQGKPSKRDMAAGDGICEGDV